ISTHRQTYNLSSSFFCGLNLVYLYHRLQNMFMSHMGHALQYSALRYNNKSHPLDSGWKMVIAIFEFKTSTSTRQMCEKQQNKSVRLNATILLELEARGLDLQHSFPIIVEGRGLGMDFYMLRRFDDVLGAGRLTAKGISLP
ncbi:hypothetical protein FBU30_011317, partial [Linnemannia zychae]